MADDIPAVQHTPDETTPAVPSLADSIHCFQTTPTNRPRRSRARFTTEERERVLSVRRRGACLRCRILKIQCSLDNPCQPCLQSAVRGSERKVLSFCYCVRTRFADVNIFDSSADAITMQIETLMRAMSDLLARIAAPADFTLTSSPTAFNNTMVSWLTDADFHLPNGSIVGLCCSSLLGLQFQEDTAAGTDGLITDFRRFLLATSLAHAGWRDGHAPKTITTTRHLCAAGHMSGCRLLKRLDRVLTPQFLARCGRESCQVLFLLVLGAVLGVGYSSSHLLEHPSPRFPPSAAAEDMLSPEFQRSPTLWLAMKEHLCQMLAHHLIFVGSMLGIKLDTGVERRIIDTAVGRWKKAEEFVWADAVRLRDSVRRGEQPEGVNGEDSGGDAVLGDGRQKTPMWNGISRPEPPRLVPIPCPQAKQFHPQATEAWAGNPQSYLSMFDEPSNTGTPESDTQESAPPRTAPAPRLWQQDLEPSRREGKRRSIWVVRPFDAGPEHGLINVHARVRAGMGMESIRGFV